MLHRRFSLAQREQYFCSALLNQSVQGAVCPITQVPLSDLSVLDQSQAVFFGSSTHPYFTRL